MDKQVILLMDHKHKGKQYYAGQTITLPADEADWLVNAVIGTRMLRAEAAKKVPGTLEARAEKAGNGRADVV